MSVADRVDRLGAAWRRPVVLYDTAMRLVAHSAHTADDIDPNRREAILSRRTEPRALELVRASGVRAAGGPVLIASDPGHADRIGVAVRSRGSVLGYLVATVQPWELPLDAGSHALITEAAEEVAQLLAHQAVAASEAAVHRAELVEALLGPDPEARDRAATELSAGGFPRTDHGYVVTVVDPADTALAADTTASPGPSPLPVLPPDSIGTMLAGCFTAVSPLLDAPTPAGPYRPRSVPDGARIGIGARRDALDSLTGSLREARLALDATRRDSARYPALASWTALGADQLLLRLPLADLSPADLPAAVRRLLDAPSGPDLARTAETYLDQAGDAQATARVLTVHRSTLYYRLDRIRHLTGVDLRRGGGRHELQTGLRVATLIGARPAG